MDSMMHLVASVAAAMLRENTPATSTEDPKTADPNVQQGTSANLNLDAVFAAETEVPVELLETALAGDHKESGGANKESGAETSVAKPMPKSKNDDESKEILASPKHNKVINVDDIDTVSPKPQRFKPPPFNLVEQEVIDVDLETSLLCPNVYEFTGSNLEFAQQTTHYGTKELQRNNWQSIHQCSAQRVW